MREKLGFLPAASDAVGRTSHISGSAALTESKGAVTVTGVFDIHGTSRRLTVPLQMRLSSAGLEAVGSVTFPWSEFNMTAPSIGGFVNVSSAATMEFDLHLKRA